jgi:hypothetical protein
LKRLKRQRLLQWLKKLQRQSLKWLSPLNL